MNNTFYSYSSSLYHHGIKGQRWGVRRFQNEDGSLTPAGRRRVLKAMKQHERITQSTNSKRKQKREYKKFKKMTLSMTDGEIKELINKLQEDSAINNMTNTNFDRLQSNDSHKLIENGLKYIQSGASIISTISAMSNASKLNKYSVAAKAADIEKTKAMTKESKARAEAKEFENYTTRMKYLDEKEAKINANYTPSKQPYTPVKVSALKPNLLPSKQQYTPVKVEALKPKLLTANAANKPTPMRNWDAKPKSTASYVSSGVNWGKALQQKQNSFSRTPLTALPSYSSVSKTTYTPVMMQVSQTALPAISGVDQHKR